MNEKEVKKIDETGEEKISGGTKFLKDNLVDPKLKILSYYGAPMIRPVITSITEPLKFYDKKKVEETKKEKNPQDALTNSQPQTEDKK